MSKASPKVKDLQVSLNAITSEVSSSLTELQLNTDTAVQAVQFRIPAESFPARECPDTWEAKK